MSSYNGTHFFSTVVASKTDIETAVMLQNLAMWIEKNQLNNTHFHDGYYWTYNSMTAFEQQFTYLSKSQIRRIFKNLEKNGYIIVGNYNSNKYDRTKWYTITQKGWDLFTDEHAKNPLMTDLSESTNGSVGNDKWICQNQQMEVSENTNGFVGNDRPIPYRIHIEEHIDKNIYKEKKFTPPTLDEVKAYCDERDNHIDPQNFIDFYQSKGWLVGKNKMKDWKACIRTWEKNNNQTTPKYGRSNNFEIEGITRI